MDGLKLRYDLSTFVECLASTCTGGGISPGEAMIQIDLEIADTESSLSRDSRTRFDQLRYVKSLRRLMHFLQSHELPGDLTPRERLALRQLGDCLHDGVTGALSAALHQVTLPAGVFGHNFEMQHHLAG